MRDIYNWLLLGVSIALCAVAFYFGWHAMFPTYVGSAEDLGSMSTQSYQDAMLFSFFLVLGAPAGYFALEKLDLKLL